MAVLVQQGVKVALDGKYKKLTTMKDSEWEKVDQKAFSIYSVVYYKRCIGRGPFRENGIFTVDQVEVITTMKDSEWEEVDQKAFSIYSVVYYRRCIGRGPFRENGIFTMD